MYQPAIDQDALLSMLQHLITTESINPELDPQGSGEAPLAHWLKDYLQNIGLEVQVQTLGEKRCNVIGVLGGQGNGPSLMLNGHLDTVGVAGMKIKPFSPTQKSGRVYGRGSQDMKGGVAAMIAAVHAIRTAGIRLQGDLIIACVADEEYLSIGTEALLKTFTADAAIVTEPTDERVAIAHKGFVWSRVEVQGKAAHGSRPEEGVDAILGMGQVLQALSEWESHILPQRHHPLLGRASLHASMIEGGTEISVYPAHCELKVERRTLPGESAETVRQEWQTMLKALRAKDPALQVQYQVYAERRPLAVSADEAIVQQLLQAHQQVAGKSPSIGGVSFWTDAALLQAAGIPSVIYGPKGQGLHSASEYVEWESVLRVAEVLAACACGFCGVVGS